MTSALTTTPSLRQTLRLLPREHDAWPQLLFPLLTAAVVASRPAGWAIAMSATALFASAGPIGVLVGNRGSRVQRRTEARRILGRLGAAATVGLIGLLLTLPAPTLPFLLAALAANALMPAALLLGEEKSAPAEPLAPVALSAGVMSILLHGGYSPAGALATWLVWSLGYGLTTLSVRAITPRAGSWWRGGVGDLCAEAVIGAILEPPLSDLIPLGAAGAIIAVFISSARSIRAAGWALVAASCSSKARGIKSQQSGKMCPNPCVRLGRRALDGAARSAYLLRQSPEQVTNTKENLDGSDGSNDGRDQRDVLFISRCRLSEDRHGETRHAGQAAGAGRPQVLDW